MEPCDICGGVWMHLDWCPESIQQVVEMICVAKKNGEFETEASLRLDALKQWGRKVSEWDATQN